MLRVTDPLKHFWSPGFGDRGIRVNRVPSGAAGMNLIGNGGLDMLRKKWVKAGSLVLAAAGLAGAHLSTTGLKPTAGESVNLGSTYKVTWTSVNDHAMGTNIDLSTDGGATWTTIRENFDEAEGVNNFNWTVAGTATENAMIRLCQHGGTPIRSCLATQKTNSLSTPLNGNYIMVTSPFKLTGSSALVQAAAGKASFALDFNPATRNVNVSFALAESGPVLLQAFDTRGRLMATLVERDFAAGSHTLSLFSNRLETSGALLFKLTAGAQVQSHNWTPAR